MRIEEKDICWIFQREMASSNSLLLLCSYDSLVLQLGVIVHAKLAKNDTCRLCFVVILHVDDAVKCAGLSTSPVLVL
jgi:hypothetical protein